MKKLIALLLAAVMCLSLAACGSGEKTPNANDNSGTQQGEQLGDESTENNNTENTENPYANHPHLTYIYGQWELIAKDSYRQDEEIPCSVLTINEDGTCLVDGISGTWDFSDETRDDFLKINIFTGGEHRYACGYYERDKAIAVWSAEYFGAIDTSWVNMSTTEVITLTTDNWREYFELVTEATYEKDEFGEIDSLSLHQYIVLKEVYANNVVYENDVVAEFERKANCYNIDLDIANQSYTLGEVVEECVFADEIGYMGMYGDYRIKVDTNHRIYEKYNSDPNSIYGKTVILVDDINDIEFLRVKGTLYITKQ